MAEILVLAEHDGESVKKVTGELLTLARGYGEPAVVWTGDGVEGGRARLAEFGAAKVYVADGAGLRRLRGGAEGRVARPARRRQGSGRSAGRRDLRRS